MSELTRKLRERVDELVRPHVQIYGPDHPPVKMALLVLAEAEAIEQQLGEERVTTDRAHEITGWARETLCKYARMRLDGQDSIPDTWATLQVEDTPSGYVFALGSIPPNPRANAA